MERVPGKSLLYRQQAEGEGGDIGRQATALSHGSGEEVCLYVCTLCHSMVYRKKMSNLYTHLHALYDNVRHSPGNNHLLSLFLTGIMSVQFSFGERV